MEFIKKLFKALNSAQHPWQVTLAITLGMVAGLTPMSGTQTLLILFVVFLLNIHIGLFFAASALFAGIAYIFDPWMEQLGYMLLTSESLKELYTAWYNNGLLRLSHFNNTLVMGATVLSLLLALPLFFGLNVTISLYRDRIAAYLNGNKWLSRLGIFKVSTKKEPIIRWWGAGLYIAVVGGVAVLLVLVIDPFLKWGIEKSASGILQRDVRVGSVNTELFKGFVGINRIEVASDKEEIDLFSIDKIAFDLDMNALLLSKTHIENMQFQGVGFGTEATMKKRYGDAVKEKEKEAVASKQQVKSFEIPSIDLPTPKELLAKADLKSKKIYDKAKKEYETLDAKWRKIQKEQLSKEVLLQYQNDLKVMQEDARSKDPQKLLALAQKVTDYQKKLDEQKKTLLSLKKEFTADKKRAAALLAEMKNAPQEDYARLRSNYTLDASGGINLFGLLFSQKIAHYLHLARGYYAKAEPYLKSDEVPQELPPRGEGRWIRYAQYLPSPDLWIARTELSGEKSAQRFEGIISDLSDDQKALGRALTFEAKSDGPLVKGLQLEGEDNRLGEQTVDTLRFKANAIAMERFDLNKIQIDNSRIGFDGKLILYEGRDISGSGHVVFKEAQISLEGLNGKGAQVMNDMLREIRQFGADVDVEGNWQSPSVKVASDLDKKLSAAFRKVMAKEAEKYKKELKVLLDEQLKEQLGKLNEMSGGMADTGKLLEQQNLSLGALQQQAEALLGGKSSQKLLKDQKSQEKVKKLFGF
ncbi:TIGR03545 family protein [Sulfurimonas sp. HSL3-7]|uniref:TIGR03545 family protein n=1 Tax=Sulfonitrofixus jiaomeiensis TaxID=3131938 RepID=UPI0031F9F135